MKSSHGPSVWYREPMVWLVLMIPASAVVMGAVMLSLAVSTYDGLVVDGRLADIGGGHGAFLARNGMTGRAR